MPLTETQLERETRDVGGPDAPRVPSVRKRVGVSLARSLFAVIAGTLVLRLAAQTMGLMLQSYFESISNNHFPLSHTVTGLITASFFIAEMIGAPVLGAMSDRYGRKLFIYLGPILGAIAVQITSMTIIIWLLVFTRILEGLSTASSVPATLGYISEATAGRPRLRARIMGLFEITLVGGIALGAVASGYLWEFFGNPRDILGIHLISPAFSLNGLIYLLSLAVFVWGLRNARRMKAKRPMGAAHEIRRHLAILRTPSVWRFVPAWLAIFSLIGLWINHSPRLFKGQDRLGGQLLMGSITEVQFGNGFAFLAIFFGAGVLAWSFYLGRWRKTSVMLIATLGLFFTLASVYAINHLGSFSSFFYYPLMVALFIGLFVLSGFTPAALTYLADVTESHREDRGSIMGLYSVFLGVGQFIGTALGGKFADWGGIDGLLFLSAILGLVTVYTLVNLRRQEMPLRIASSNSP
ncbi:MAG TPA: MFS transporter [Blastocatellia bacterium]|jgi:MFS family permease